MNEDKERLLGDWLRQRREELEISLEQAEADTRIRARYLEALETEDFDSLPGPVVGRGFLRNYAAYLELDPLKAADIYAKLDTPPEPEILSVEESTPFTTGPFRPVPLHKMPGGGRRGWIAILTVILLVALAALVWVGYPYFSAWLASRPAVAEPTPTRRATAIALSTATHTPTTVATSAVLEATATGAPATPTLELTITPSITPSPSPTLTPSPPVYTGIFLELVFTDTSWIQVTVDGVRQFQGELEAETHRSWYGEERIELRVGNAGAVLVTVNGQFLGTLGAYGDVVDRVFEKMDDQVIEATPTPVVTGTVTIEPTTNTVAPTRTSTPPATITPTQSITPTASP